MAAFDEIMINIAAAVPELTSPSQLATFNKIAQAVAISIDNTLAELNNTEAIIDDIIGRQRYGRSGYYTGKAKAFQYGDSLVVDPATLDYVYAVIDEDKKIIKQAAFKAAISGGAQILTLKVAKLDTNTNTLVKLEAAEKSAFDSYFLNFEIPGLPMTKVSLDANLFGFNAAVTYYSTYDRNAIIAGVQTALLDFRDNFEFDGVLYVNDLETYIKNNVPGVRNVSLSNTEIDNVAFAGSVELIAGYFDFIANIANYFTYGSI